MTADPISLDTNVLSDIMSTRPADKVVRFVAELENPLVSAAVFHEFAYGAARLPEGDRKFRLIAEMAAFHRRYQRRIIQIDYEVARLSGELRAKAQALGHDLKPMDAMIAASAIHVGAKLATRNIKDFAYLGIDLVNPWTL